MSELDFGRVSEEEEKRRRNLHNKGLSDSEMAKELNLSISAVGRWRNRRGLPRNKPEGFGFQDFPRRRKLYDKGLSDREIGKKVGVSASAISSWRNRRSLPSNKREFYPNSTEGERMHLYERGLNDQEIAEKVEVTSRSIATWRDIRDLDPNGQIGGALLDIDLSPTRTMGYFCGLVIGDGCIYRAGRNRQFIIESTKTRIVERFCNIAEKIGLNPRRYTRIQTYEFSDGGGFDNTKKYIAKASSKKLFDVLKPCKKEDFHWEVPKFLTSKESMWGFVEGMFDADGCFHVRNGEPHSLIIVSKHKDGLSSLKSFLEKEGITTHIYSQSHNDCFRLQVRSRSSIIDFIEECEFSFKIEDKISEIEA